MWFYSFFFPFLPLEPKMMESWAIAGCSLAQSFINTDGHNPLAALPKASQCQPQCMEQCHHTDALWPPPGAHTGTHSGCHPLSHTTSPCPCGQPQLIDLIRQFPQGKLVRIQKGFNCQDVCLNLPSFSPLNSQQGGEKSQQCC